MKIFSRLLESDKVFIKMGIEGKEYPINNLDPPNNTGVADYKLEFID